MKYVLVVQQEAEVGLKTRAVGPLDDQDISMGDALGRVHEVPEVFAAYPLVLETFEEMTQ